MSIEIKIPTVGESITEVTIGTWLKEDGTVVEMDEAICELESDKATFELNAESSGTLRHRAAEGDTLEIGQVVCIIEPGEKQGKPAEKVPAPSSSQNGREAEKKGPDATTAEPRKTGRVIDMKIPEVGESISEVTISTWLKKDGDAVEMDEVIAEIDSDKATFELTAEARGILKIQAKENETLAVGKLVCQIEELEAIAQAAEPSEVTDQSQEQTSTPDQSTPDGYAAGHPSPAAAKILAEKGLEPTGIKGSGIDGRVTKDDAVKAQKEEGIKIETTPAPEATIPGARGERREKMSTLRKTISRRLVSVKNETAMLTTFNEVNMEPIMSIRKKYKESFKEKYDVNLGFMSFFVKACCLALQEWPSVNAKIDGEEVLYHDYCDVSIAVSTPKGLVVPVIRNAESRSFDNIEKEIVELATKARDGKLSIEEMQGGTFTITNGGVFGSMLSTPIINAPQSAILGMHNIVQRPVAENGEVVIRPVMYIALSYDHRIIDGRESVSFLVRVKELLEDPTRLLLGI
jgi:2-oxoglutarate dehydrogenase E2 component (dihydrolipoamide succinyltransferase)